MHLCLYMSVSVCTYKYKPKVEKSLHLYNLRPARCTLYIHICIYLNIHKNQHKHMCIHMHIHMNMKMHSYTCTHSYIRVCLCVRVSNLGCWSKCGVLLKANLRSAAFLKAWPKSVAQSLSTNNRLRSCWCGRMCMGGGMTIHSTIYIRTNKSSTPNLFHKNHLIKIQNLEDIDSENSNTGGGPTL